MSRSSSSSPGGVGIGFGGMLAILFIGLKLTHHIDWPWVWVLCPLWIPFAVLAVLAIVFGVAVLVAAAIDAAGDGKPAGRRGR